MHPDLAPLLRAAQQPQGKTVVLLVVEAHWTRERGRSRVHKAGIQAFSRLQEFYW